MSAFLVLVPTEPKSIPDFTPIIYPPLGAYTTAKTTFRSRPISSTILVQTFREYQDKMDALL